MTARRLHLRRMIEGHLDGSPWLTYELPAPVSGKVDL